MDLSNDQNKAIEQLLKWYKDPDKNQIVTLGGYAGTGKTTLISVFKNKLETEFEKKTKVAFCSYTGRAAQNLKRKLEIFNSIKSRDSLSTIHGLIYSPIENDRGVIIGWNRKEAIEKDLIIVDEASMIDGPILSDLKSYGIPIIAVGDHGQLPPINASFNLMQSPQLVLEEIHRQAKESPIIDISIHARKNGYIPPKTYSPTVAKYTKDNFDYNEISQELLQNYNKDTLILCGYNFTRTKINEFVRYSLGFETKEPKVGDRVICLRNNHEKNIYNGMLGEILDIEYTNNDFYSVEIQMDDMEKPYVGKIYAKQFGSKEPINFTKDRKKANELDLFDFGYALTVHKAQGSQAKKVILFEERFSKMDDDQWRRWLYTAVTRAEEELYIFGNN